MFFSLKLKFLIAVVSGSLLTTAIAHADSRTNTDNTTAATGIESPVMVSSLIDVERSSGGIISLLSPSCRELTEQEKYLRDWTLRREESPGSPSLPVENRETGRCSLVINNSVPYIVKLLQSYKASYNGPNCWNTSLMLTGLTEYSRFSSPEEMTFWMTSKYCREVSSSEKSLPGDIIAIRGENLKSPSSFDELHGMIYISDKLVFSKNTSSHMSPFGIQRSNLVYQTFRLEDSECMKIVGQPVGCSRWSNHYRCSGSLEDRRSLENESPTFEKISSEVHKIESAFSEFVLYGEGPYQTNAKTINQQLDVIEKNILAQTNASPKEEFFFKALLLDVRSLKAQATILKVLIRDI